MAFFQVLPWHQGEADMMKAMHVPHLDNPTYPSLSPQLANHLQVAPLIVIGTLDKEGRPWTTLWGGESGMARSLGGGIVGIKTPVTGQHDPVVEELVGKAPTGEVVREEGTGRMVSGLTIDLETRKRVKMYGRMIAGALMLREDEATGTQQHVVEMQLVLKIEQSLGNCPKYLNKKRITPATSAPEIISDSPHLSRHAVALLEKADLFFISSAQKDQDMDTNHRGGPAGFVRVVSNDASGAVLCYPEYSGNRLYQTLGNLKVNPVAGLCVPDFEMGDMMYLTGKTEILIGAEAAKLLPRSNLAVKITVTAARFVAKALPFRGVAGEMSPYNPNIRLLASEKQTSIPQGTQLSQAVLLQQTKLTPTISRFKFALSNATTHKAGQYVTFDFSSRLDIGYSHMRDDDPLSLNDDFVRTFTVSSPPGQPPNPVRRLKDDEFEITVRKVGTVTEELFKHSGTENDDRVPLEVGIKGFGGDFEIQQGSKDDEIAFIAAGIGITPLLASLRTLDPSKLTLLWTMRQEDFGLAEDVLAEWPELSQGLKLFIANADYGTMKRDMVVPRRLGKEDTDALVARKIYLCTAVPLRKKLMEWLPDKELVFEDFNF